MSASGQDEHFSIIKGGLLDQALRFLHVIRHGNPKNTIRKIIFFVIITWVPLLILNLLFGYFWGDQVKVPFLYDFPFHVRFLVAIPLLFIAEGIADKRIGLIVNQFNKSELLFEKDKPEFGRIKKITDRMIDSAWAEAIIMILVTGNLVFRWVSHDVEISTWVIPDVSENHKVSWAAWWLLTVSMPLFQFFILRWLWRWIVWFRLHWMISHINLNLSPTHPDRAGGLGFLGEPPAPFSMVTLTFGLVISSVIASKMIFFEKELAEFYIHIAVFVILCVLINMLPLVIYFMPMRLTRIKGIFEFSALVQKHHLQFKDKWFVSSTNDELLIGNPDISSMCDFTPVYESIERMTPFPFDLKAMLATVITSLVPLLPLAALIMPIGDLLKLLVGLVL